MTKDYRDYILDIIESIHDIDMFINNMEFKDILSDKKTAHAVVRCLEIIGEAANKIPQDIKINYSEIPWKQLIGMRNKLIHEYFGVDLEIVWVVITEELPPLLPLFEDILAELNGN